MLSISSSGSSGTSLFFKRPDRVGKTRAMVALGCAAVMLIPACDKDYADDDFIDTPPDVFYCSEESVPNPRLAGWVPHTTSDSDDYNAFCGFSKSFGFRATGPEYYGCAAWNFVNCPSDQRASCRSPSVMQNPTRAYSYNDGVDVIVFSTYLNLYGQYDIELSSSPIVFGRPSDTQVVIGYARAILPGSDEPRPGYLVTDYTLTGFDDGFEPACKETPFSPSFGRGPVFGFAGAPDEILEFEKPTLNLCAYSRDTQESTQVEPFDSDFTVLDFWQTGVGFDPFSHSIVGISSTATNETVPEAVQAGKQLALTCSTQVFGEPMREVQLATLQGESYLLTLCGARYPHSLCDNVVVAAKYPTHSVKFENTDIDLGSSATQHAIAIVSQRETGITIRGIGHYAKEPVFTTPFVCGAPTGNKGLALRLWDVASFRFDHPTIDKRVAEITGDGYGVVFVDKDARPQRVSIMTRAAVGSDSSGPPSCTGESAAVDTRGFVALKDGRTLAFVRDSGTGLCVDGQLISDPAKLGLKQDGFYVLDGEGKLETAFFISNEIGAFDLVDLVEAPDGTLFLSAFDNCGAGANVLMRVRIKAK